MKLFELRAVQACPKCFDAHDNEKRKAKGLSSSSAVYQKAIVWAWHCDDCANRILDAVESCIQSARVDGWATMKQRINLALQEPMPKCKYEPFEVATCGDRFRDAVCILPKGHEGSHSDGLAKCERCARGMARIPRAGCEGTYYVHHEPLAKSQYDMWPLCQVSATQ